jgi:hypothetical protein
MNVALIIGCARSGTSILGELIASHPDVQYIFEASPIWEWGGYGVNESHRLTAMHATPVIKEKIRNWFQDQAKDDALLLVEKNPRNALRVPYIREIFPQAKIIHIVRDGRDVACSMVPGCGKEEWSHLKPPSWKELFNRYEGAMRCAYAWKEIMEIALQDLSVVPHLQIRYEDLVMSPHNVADGILSYLGLHKSPVVTDFCNKIRNETSFYYHAQYQEHWYRNNHQARIGRWHENLTDLESERMNSLLSPLLTRLGYSVD